MSGHRKSDVEPGQLPARRVAHVHAHTRVLHGKAQEELRQDTRRKTGQANALSLQEPWDGPHTLLDSRSGQESSVILCDFSACTFEEEDVEKLRVVGPPPLDLCRKRLSSSSPPRRRNPLPPLPTALSETWPGSLFITAFPDCSSRFNPLLFSQVHLLRGVSGPGRQGVE